MISPPLTVPMEPPNVPLIICHAATIPRLDGARSCAMMAKPAGPHPAQDSPPNVRAAMRTPTVGAKPEIGCESMQMPANTRHVNVRPMTSASVPIAGDSIALENCEPRPTHAATSVEHPNLRWVTRTQPKVPEVKPRGVPGGFSVRFSESGEGAWGPEGGAKLALP